MENIFDSMGFGIVLANFSNSLEKVGIVLMNVSDKSERVQKVLKIVLVWKRLE